MDLLVERRDVFVANSHQQERSLLFQKCRPGNGKEAGPARRARAHINTPRFWCVWVRPEGAAGARCPRTVSLPGGLCLGGCRECGPRLRWGVSPPSWGSLKPSAADCIHSTAAWGAGGAPHIHEAAAPGEDSRRDFPKATGEGGAQLGPWSGGGQGWEGAQCQVVTVLCHLAFSIQGDIGQRPPVPVPPSLGGHVVTWRRLCSLALARVALPCWGRAWGADET